MRNARNSRSTRNSASGNVALPPAYQAIIERTQPLDPHYEATLLERATLGSAAARALEQSTLSQELRKELEARVKEGQCAKEKLVLAYLHIVPNIVATYSGNLPFMDLVQEGNVGLVRAAENYDPAHGTFHSFASRWVRRSVVRAIAANNRVEQLVVRPVEHAELSGLHRRVRQALSHLDALESTVLELRFGLVDGTTQTLEEIGSRLGVTRERVQQIITDALAQLRGVVTPLPAMA